MFSRPSFRGLLTNHCSYSVEGGAASRLGQCSHAFVRTLFAQGNTAGWVHQQVPRHSIFCFTLVIGLQPELVADFLARRKTHMASDEDVAGGGRRKRRRVAA